MRIKKYGICFSCMLFLLSACGASPDGDAVLAKAPSEVWYRKPKVDSNKAEQDLKACGEKGFKKNTPKKIALANEKQVITCMEKKGYQTFQDKNYSFHHKNESEENTSRIVSPGEDNPVIEAGKTILLLPLMIPVFILWGLSGDA